MRPQKIELKNSIELGSLKSIPETDYLEDEIDRYEKASLFAFTERSDLPYLILSIISMMATAACSAGQSIVYGQAFDILGSFIRGRIDSKIFVQKTGFTCGMIVVIGASRAALIWFGTMMSMIFGEIQARRARTAVTNLILSKDLLWLDQSGNVIGDLTQVNRCVEEFREGLSEALGQFVLSVSTVISLFVTGMIYSWSLTLVMSATFPLIFGIGYCFWRLMYRAVEAENHWSSMASNVVNWIVAKSSIVRIFNGQKAEADKFHMYTASSAASFTRLSNLSAMNDGIIKTIGLSMCVEGFWYGITLIKNHSATIQNVFTAFSACMMIGPEISEVSDQICTINEAKAGILRILSVTGTKEQGHKVDLGLYPSISKYLVRLREVSFQYQPDLSYSIEHLNLEVKHGTFSFIIGQSGCGKSTVADLMMGFRRPLDGTVSLGDISMDLLSRKWINDHVTLIQQDSIVFEGSLKNNICYARREELPQSTIDSAYEFAELGELISTIGGEDAPISSDSISGGQRQRIGLARAWVRNTPILILDEALGSLDGSSRARMMDRIRSWRKGKTTIIITHNLREIESDDNVILMERGSIVLQGRLNEIRDEKEYLRFKGEERKKRQSMVGGSSVVSVEEISVDEEDETSVNVLSALRILSDCRSYLPRWYIIAAGLIGSIFTGIMTPIFSFCSSHMLNIMITPHTEKKVLVTWSCYALVVALATGIFTYLTQFVMAYVSEQWIFRIRQSVFLNLCSQEVQFFTKTNPTYLTSLLMNDTRDLRCLISQWLTIYTGLVVMVVVGVVWAIVVGWKLALVGISFGPILFAITSGYARIMEVAEDRYKTRVTYSEQLSQECISNLRTIICFDLNEMFKIKSFNRVSKLEQEGKRRAVYIGLGLALTDLCASASTATILYYGMTLIGLGEYTTGQFVQVVTMLTFVMTTGATLLHQIPEIARAQRVGSHISRLLQLPSSTLETGGTKCPNYFPVSSLIEVRHLTFGYVQGYQIFDGLSFHVNKGEVVGIVGKSGRGKSTLFKLLLKLCSVRPGTIFVGGTDINLVSTLWWRSQIAIIPQDADLFEGTIYANLTYGLENGNFSADEIDTVLEKVNLLDFVNGLPEGLQTNISVYPSCSLSGGQAQRLCIARSLLRKPQIMLFDECTSKLDPANKGLIIELMKGRRDMTMLVIAHDSDVMLVVDRKVYI
ncbi:hypothetical protein QFC19_008102 [Naganishia cerealis]|uniref:Uncharacterized protein n=1 Tax=Naganishia cerealis TaxID=610337 RepID=A0ACC2V4P6_9TREE|nr:hypothetical protein QFC19_008102 [Naganishia cerealis]